MDDLDVALAEDERRWFVGEYLSRWDSVRDWAKPPMLTVYCARDHGDGAATAHSEWCDGMFCACPCHTGRSDRRWLHGVRWYREDHPRSHVLDPVGVL